LINLKGKNSLAIAKDGQNHDLENKNKIPKFKQRLLFIFKMNFKVNCNFYSLLLARVVSSGIQNYKKKLIANTSYKYIENVINCK